MIESNDNAKLINNKEYNQLNRTYHKFEMHSLAHHC